MAKVLLVDTNFSSGPIYEELVSMGLHVHVVGNNPGDFLAKATPNYWNRDYADTESLAALVDEEKFDFLVPGCTDRSYLSCAAVSRGRFPGFDTADACEAIFNKRKFRVLADRLGMPVPKKLFSGMRPTAWPIIVKPVDAFSGKGITVLREDNAYALEHALKLARDTSPTGEYLIEQFVEGQLHSHTAFLREGKIVQDFIVQEDSTVNPFVVDTSRVLSDVNPELLEQLRAFVEIMANELTLADGLLHTQFISAGNELWMIEITRRCPGDLYSQLIELTTGYRYCQSYTLPFLGKSVQKYSVKLRNDLIMRHTITIKNTQSFAYLRFNSALHIERLTPLSVAGDQLKPSPKSRIGILFCRATDQENLDHIYESTLQQNLYEVHDRSVSSPGISQ
jgi:hypothetical protein